MYRGLVSFPKNSQKDPWPLKYWQYVVVGLRER